MKKWMSMCLLSLVCFMGSGCMFVDAQYPLDEDFTNTELGSKVGRATATSVLWLFAWGDAGSKAAAEQGGIKVIKHADVHVFSILFGLYSEVTTVLYGD
jgi:hypothetical protein